MKCVLLCASLWVAIRTSYWERSVCPWVSLQRRAFPLKPKPGLSGPPVHPSQNEGWGTRRLTNAFSKKLDNLKAAVALHFAYYNFLPRPQISSRDSGDGIWLNRSCVDDC